MGSGQAWEIPNGKLKMGNCSQLLAKSPFSFSVVDTLEYFTILQKTDARLQTFHLANFHVVEINSIEENMIVNLTYYNLT